MSDPVKELREYLDNGPHDTYEPYEIAHQAITALEAVLELHPRMLAFVENLDYCLRCIKHEGAIWPCMTVREIYSSINDAH